MSKILFAVILLFFVFHYSVFAESPYTLPYPAVMPGNRVYLLQKIQEKIHRYWYFGDFGEYNYNLKYSDKYLIESKTLFEYKQYLLAYNALKKSNEYYSHIEPTLLRASTKNKNISEKLSLFKNASLKHKEVLEALLPIVPKEFTWTPEKESPTHLPIHTIIQDSIKMRLKIL